MPLLKKLGFLWSYSVLLVIVGGYYLGGPNWAVAGVLYVYVGIPLLDWLTGEDHSNIGHDQFDAVLNDRFFDVIVYSFVYLQYGLLGWGGYVILHDGLALWQQIALTYSIGLFGGTIINVAHELVHRSSRVALLHARLALASVCYMHWGLEHVQGHHRHVATPHDPATARRNQTMYSFWWQSLVGGYRSAWAIEKRLLAKDGKPFLSWQNQLLGFAFWPTLLCTVLTAGFSLYLGHMAWAFPLFFVGQSLVAILLLESVNYIEHYGIVRAELSPGRYERVNPLHSWNASQVVSNMVLFQLQRHSDHHAYAARPYQVLRHFDESPQLPHGYAQMILIGMVPPLWFRIMNARLDAWKAQAVDTETITKVVRQYA
ncbi:alkane 1-monooxygenase [Fibrella aquatilis]|uniref:Alkane 1-monooxygenase n=1 Tax=Fibrella aquatilis TaxID=2817059 RepID=A0A939G631_9BACT|nr:alkane 1-monooxygenase [Fibrella aquatilis]MBO0931080.1 alkane 1-monooxygenase [Fibrella aquatilis]